jgi:putative copper resistance protein D
MGALWPLWRACHDVPSDSLHQLMEKFGAYAAVSVLVLIVCGGILGFQLVGSFDMLFFTDYGQGIAIKLFTVSLILLVAAYHKWKLVPALLKKQSSDVLARSIVIEMYLGVAVLGITTVASTLMGPAH